MEMSTELVEVKVQIARLQEKLVASQDALIIAREVLKQWQAVSNEWRLENIDQRNLFITIKEAQALVATLETRIYAVENYVSKNTGAKDQSHSNWLVFTTIISLLIAFFSIIIRLKGGI